MKIDLKNALVHDVQDKRSDPKRPTVVIVIDEEATGKWPSYVAFDFGGDRLDDRAAIPIGSRVEVSGYIGSRDWKGKWYTNIKGTFCKLVSSVATGDDRSNQAPPMDDDTPF